MSSPEPARRSLLVGGAILALAAALFAFDPETAGVFPPCPFRLATGWSCPGCGTARACHHLLHGDLAGAWRLNPLAVLAVPPLAWVALSSVLARRGRALPLPRVSGAGWAAIAVAVLAWGVARNL